jgi:hypothetical protein
MSFKSDLTDERNFIPAGVNRQNEEKAILEEEVYQYSYQKNGEN